MLQQMLNRVQLFLCERVVTTDAKSPSNETQKYIVCFCPLEQHIEAFSDPTLLLAGLLKIKNIDAKINTLVRFRVGMPVSVNFAYESPQNEMKYKRLFL